jgi:hypothetical protein
MSIYLCGYCSTIVLRRRFKSTGWTILGGTTEMEIHNIFGREATLVFTPVSVASNIIALNLLFLAIAILVCKLH